MRGDHMNIYKREGKQLNADNSTGVTFTRPNDAETLVKVLTNLGIYTESWADISPNGEYYRVRIPNDIDTSNFCHIIKDHRKDNP